MKKAGLIISIVGGVLASIGALVMGILFTTLNPIIWAFVVPFILIELFVIFFIFTRYEKYPVTSGVLAILFTFILGGIFLLISIEEESNNK